PAPRKPPTQIPVVRGRGTWLLLTFRGEHSAAATKWRPSLPTCSFGRSPAKSRIKPAPESVPSPMRSQSGLVDRAEVGARLPVVHPHAPVAPAGRRASRPCWPTVLRLAQAPSRVIPAKPRAPTPAQRPAICLSFGPAAVVLLAPPVP